MSSEDNADYLLKQARNHGITNPQELVNFMGQMQVESGGFARTRSSPSASTPAPWTATRLWQTCSNRFKSEDPARAKIPSNSLPRTF